MRDIKLLMFMLTFKEVKKPCCCRNILEVEACSYKASLTHFSKYKKNELS